MASLTSKESRRQRIDFRITSPRKQQLVGIGNKYGYKVATEATSSTLVVSMTPCRQSRQCRHACECVEATLDHSSVLCSSQAYVPAAAYFMAGGSIGSCECCKIHTGTFRKNKNKNKKNEILRSEVTTIEIEDSACDF